MAPWLFDRRLWRRINDAFREPPHFYIDAPRPPTYRQKQALMYEHFPRDAAASTQAAYLVKNLVNLQRYPDANKRSASILLEVFLETNGFALDCPDDAYAAFLIDVQRKVPPEAWDGRSFSLKPEFIPWREDAYHAFLREWMERHIKSKS